jgi:hypothetical protein
MYDGRFPRLPNASWTQRGRESFLFSGTIVILSVSKEMRLGVCNDEEFRRLARFCPCTFVPASHPQTKPQKNQAISYSDADSYQVLSSVIDARTEKLKDGSVSIFHQTVSEDAFGEVRAQCSSRFPREFQSALEDFDKKAKTNFLLQREFAIHRDYRFVEAVVGVQTGIYSMSAVGFDEDKTHAIVLVQYLVRPAGSIILGGSRVFYLFRRTSTGWEQAADIPLCGQIY